MQLRPAHPSSSSLWVGHSVGKGIAFIALAVTLGASVFAVADVVEIARRMAHHGDWAGFAQQASFAIVIVFLIYGNLVYQITRYGHYRRRAAYRPVPIEQLRRLHRDDAPRLAVLVPAYKEEEQVVLQTLLSAALLEYPFNRVILLIDDPPGSRATQDRENLECMRRLPGRVRDMLRMPALQFRRELESYLVRSSIGASAPVQECARLAVLFVVAAEHIERVGETVWGHDHPSVFFRDQITGTMAKELRDAAADWRKLATDPLFPPGISGAIESGFRRLASHFSARLSSFERKTYRNLSHTPNKAMNLNAYLDLMGQWVREVHNSDGSCELIPCVEAEAAQYFPDADYVITLDADSLLQNDYALRLVDFLERPENARVAIAQTPYSAFPNAPGTLERVAGITTDIQHIVHQGFTQFGSTYWVGANALIRKKALLDIVTTEREGEKTVRKFIQDRTVIEDTESSVDLWLKGWSLHNYPVRLAYSATPPDFGALVIQRRRWANGGLIILPKLLRYIVQRPFTATKLQNGFIQTNYLVSIAASSTGVLLMLLFPFEESMRSWWLPITAAPYFLLYGADMCALGYRRADLLRVYALNMTLIPVNLGGVLASLRQAVTGRKSPFGRTPKVASRTATPASCIIGVFALSLYCIGNGVFDAFAQRWAHAAFALLNGGFLAYGSAVYVGLREGFDDLRARFRHVRPSAAEDIAPATPPIYEVSGVTPFVRVERTGLATFSRPRQPIAEQVDAKAKTLP